jgi:hypothetical protein
MDAAEYWKAADMNERNNGVLFRQVEIAIPHELDERQRRDAVREFAERVSRHDGGHMPYTAAIHAGNGSNPHAHIVFSERINDGHNRDRERWFKRAANKGRPPETGGARKANLGKNRTWLQDTRQLWARTANSYLMLSGHDARIDHRSNANRGIADEPTEHRGPTVAAMERKGFETDRGKQARLPAQVDELQARITEIDGAIAMMNEMIQKEQATAAAHQHRQRRARAAREKRDSEQRQRIAMTGISDSDERQRWTKAVREARESTQARLWREKYGDRLPEDIAVRYIDIAGKDGVRIDLRDGHRVIDSGDTIHARQGSAEEAVAMAEIARAKGWTSVVLSGDDAWKEVGALACLRAGVPVNWEKSEIDDELRQHIESQVQRMEGDGPAPGMSMSPEPPAVADEPKPQAANDEWDDIAEEVKAGTRHAPEFDVRLVTMEKERQERAANAAEERDHALSQILHEGLEHTPMPGGDERRSRALRR